MRYSPSIISNNILNRAFTEGIPVTPMKLQKILYFVASEYAKKTGRTLLGEPFQQWKFGPVMGSVYSEFRSYRAEPIAAFAKDANGEAFIISEGSDLHLDNALDTVWEGTKRRTAADLSRITHLPNSAWYRAWLNDERYIDDASLQADETYLDDLQLAR